MQSSCRQGQHMAQQLLLKVSHFLSKVSHFLHTALCMLLMFAQ